MTFIYFYCEYRSHQGQAIATKICNISIVENVILYNYPLGQSLSLNVVFYTSVTENVGVQFSSDQTLKALMFHQKPRSKPKPKPKLHLPVFLFALLGFAKFAVLSTTTPIHFLFFL
jgi:hypothetical protein